MKLFLVSNHSPKQVTEWLAKKSIKVSAKVAKTVISTVFYYEDTKFKQDLAALNNSIANVILFTGPITCKKYDNAYLLDIDSVDDAPYYSIKFCNLKTKTWNNAKHLIVSQKKYVHHDTVIGHIENTSILNRLMTIFYSLPLASQKVAKIIVINWMYHNTNISAEKLISIITGKIKFKNSDTLLDTLKSELCLQYIEAMNDPSTDFVEVAAYYKLSDYDLRYMETVKISNTEYNKLIRL